MGIQGTGKKSTFSRFQLNELLAAADEGILCVFRSNWIPIPGIPGQSW